MAKKNILIVDDDHNILQALKRILRKYKDIWHITTLAEPLKAVDLALQHPFDAALFDVNMPGLNGLDLLSKFQDHSCLREVQVIILTGMNDKKLKQKALDLGAADLLQKPVEKDDLVSRLSSVLRAKSYLDEIHLKNEMLTRQLIQSQKMELVGILSSGVIHDLKNMLGIISGYSQIIDMQSENDQAIKQSLQRIKDAANRANRLTMQILSFSRKSADDNQPINLGELITDNIGLFKALVPRGVTVEWNTTPGKLDVQADENQIFQLLMNLIVNAGHASSEGGKIEISLDEAQLKGKSASDGSIVPDGEYTLLQVRDEGTGMDEQTLTRIFETHFTTRSDEGGFGLGMMVVKWIIDSMNGYIRVESILGKGTTFTIYFPGLK